MVRWIILLGVQCRHKTQGLVDRVISSMASRGSSREHDASNAISFLSEPLHNPFHFRNASQSPRNSLALRSALGGHSTEAGASTLEALTRGEQDGELLHAYESPS